MPFHPLEPLTADEVVRAVELSRALPIFTASTRIISIALREPDKQLVYEWPKTAAAPGTPWACRPSLPG